MQKISKKTLDKLGRIVLPIDMRKELNLSEKSLVNIYMGKQNQIIITKSEKICNICGSTEHLKELRRKQFFICQKCKNAIANL